MYIFTKIGEANNKNMGDIMKKKNNKFAEGLCFAKLFIFFIVGCIFGTYYEEILHFVNYREWSSRQGLLIGPFNPIYGIPAVILLIFLTRGNAKRSIIKTYIYSAIISGIAEFLISFFGEHLFGIKFWDYTGYLLNINGRTTLPFMLFWGVLGVILLKFLYPYLSKWIEKVPYKIAQPVYTFALVFIIFDLALTYSVFGRMALRNSGKEPISFVGEYYDKVFTNEYMAEKFPAMKNVNNEI